MKLITLLASSQRCRCHFFPFAQEYGLKMRDEVILMTGRAGFIGYLIREHWTSVQCRCSLMQGTLVIWKRRKTGGRASIQWRERLDATALQ
jgi:hypothetical protein